MKKTYDLIDLDCAVCAGKMQDAVAKIEGIAGVEVSFIKQKMTIEFAENADPDKLMKKVCKAISKVEPDCEVVL